MPSPAVRPAHLLLRDGLLVVLTFVSGVYEAVCFLSFGKVFTAFQTGNLVFLGLLTAGTRPPAGPEPLTVVASLVAFAAGASVAMPVLRSFNGDAEVPDEQVAEVWPRRVTAVLALALLGQVAFLCTWALASPASPTAGAAPVLVGLSAFASGLQMNAIRLLHVPGVSTTAATATFISLVSGAVTWSLSAAAARRLAGVLVATAAGALLGDVLVHHAHAWVAVPPVLLTAGVVALAWCALPNGSSTPSTDPPPELIVAKEMS